MGPTQTMPAKANFCSLPSASRPSLLPRMSICKWSINKKVSFPPKLLGMGAVRGPTSRLHGVSRAGEIGVGLDRVRRGDRADLSDVLGQVLGGGPARIEGV